VIYTDTRPHADQAGRHVGQTDLELVRDSRSRSTKAPHLSSPTWKLFLPMSTPSVAMASAFRAATPWRRRAAAIPAFHPEED